MSDYLFFLFLIPLIILINFFLIKKNFLTNNTGKLHQHYTSLNQVPLSGGIYVLLFFYFFETNVEFLIFISILFLIGLIADINLINSPLKRFIIQICLIVLFIISFNIQIEDVRINWFNELLLNNLFNIFFCSFCFLVLINGSNFIDGNNCLSIGYYLLIFFIIMYLNYNNSIFFEIEKNLFFLILLFILLIFNLLNQLYLGDSGIYLISIYSGVTLINILKSNSYVSPYFIAVLLWYPAFEILFSLFRKFKNKFSPMDPDTMHLHQLIFFYLNKTKNFKKNWNNSITGLIINSYNVVILLFASIYHYYTKLQIAILLINMAIYMIAYFYFLTFKRSFEKKFDH